MKNLEVNGNTVPAYAPLAGRPVAAHAAAGGCEAPPAAASEAPALDLSLGHFGTSTRDREVDYVADGPYIVELDYSEMTATLSEDREIPTSRQERRASMRKVEKLLRAAAQSGMQIVREAI